jgi:hypothetical protein
MKNYILLLFLVAYSNVYCQTTDSSIDKGVGIYYFTAKPGIVPDESFGSEIAVNMPARVLYLWNRTGAKWERYGKIKYADGVPSGAPIDDSYIGQYDTTTGRLYRWTGNQWITGSETSISVVSSPILFDSSGVIGIDFDRLTQVDVGTITNTIMADETARIAIIDTTTALINTSDFTDLQIVNLTDRIVETDDAISNITNNAIDIKNELIVNATGTDAFVKYTGKAPTYSGNLGIYTMTFDIDSTNIKSWRFGGGSNDNIWDGSGDMQINVVLSNASPTLSELNAIFGNIQFINAGNGEVISDLKAQFQVSLFQEATSSTTVQMRASNLTGFGTEGFKMIITY